MSERTVHLPDNSVMMREQREALLAEATPALKEKVDWIVNWYQNDARNSLLSRWDLGAQVADIIRDRNKNGGKTYGSKAFHTIALFSGEAEGSLRVCARLAQLYTRGQVTDLSEQVMADGTTPLSFSHMRVILALDNAKTGEDDRRKAIAMTLERCWTAEQLGRYVKGQTGGEGTNNREGRPLAKPKGLDGVISQQLQFAEDFEKRNLKIWKDPELSVTGQLAKVDASQYTEDMANQLGTLALRLRQLADAANERATEAERRHREVRQALEKRYGEGLKMASQLSNEDGDAIEEARKEPTKIGRKKSVPA